MWKLVFLAFAVLIIVAFFIRKKINKIEIYATSFFAFTYGVTVDTIFDLHYYMYGYFDKGFDWLGLLAILIYFPVVSIIFLNLYPYKSRIIIKIVYIFGWTVLSLAFEWFSLQTKFFYYNGWKLWYSAMSYPLIFLILLINLKLVRRLIKT